MTFLYQIQLFNLRSLLWIQVMDMRMLQVVRKRSQRLPKQRPEQNLEIVRYSPSGSHKGQDIQVPEAA